MLSIAKLEVIQHVTDSEVPPLLTYGIALIVVLVVLIVSIVLLLVYKKKIDAAKKVQNTSAPELATRAAGEINATAMDLLNSVGQAQNVQE